MDRPKREDYKIKQYDKYGHYEEVIDGKYVIDLEKYCDELEEQIDLLKAEKTYK